ncbi:MAG: hypothetical protein K2J88_06470, partial [Oscillospiraceae bacterium]|nr:hypothetical protein [Oscillospiraceae bacterium]
TMLGVYGIVHLLVSPATNKNNQVETVDLEVTEPSEIETTEEPTTEPPTEPPPLVIYPEQDITTMQLDENIGSQYALLVDCDNHKILAQKGAEEKIYPASMTKLMTLIVAIEHTENFNDTFKMTQEIINDLYAQEASMAGFAGEEECSVMDMLYGAALPSGADATTGLAMYVAGSEEAFVKLMNEKVAELGLQHTHFMNCSGLHDENHYSTPTDIALILEYCLRNETCKKIISTYTYTTNSTEQHPDGITLYDSMFSKMTGTEVEGITILGGKTGYTDEAGQCLASYAQTPDGHCYIAVTSKGIGKYQSVYDAFKLYGTITGTYPMGDAVTETSAETNADMLEVPVA